MSSRPLASIILAAGKGTRLKSALPKVMHRLAGEPMLGHVLQAIAPLSPEPVVVVTGPSMDDVAAYVAPHPVSIQQQALGTADAVKAAAPLLQSFTGNVLVLYGDVPLIETKTLERMIAARDKDNHAVVMLGMRVAAPAHYGRLVTGSNGLSRIVEAFDATPEELAIDVVNAGPLVADGAVLFDLLQRIDNNNAKSEFYLTDLVAKAIASGRTCGVVETSEAEAIGINSRAELAAAEMKVQQRLRARAMEHGATLIDPETIYFSLDTKLGRDVMVGPNVIFGPGVTVADTVEIKPFCHIEGATISSNAVIGPFARLRPGTTIAENAHIGNFVEVKNTQVGRGSKANHLTYLGDAKIGENTNIGAGTITCNYDGVTKHKTIIGDNGFIGSNSILIAPVVLGNGVLTAAGSTITQDVPDETLAISRTRQTNLEGKAAKFRKAKS